MHVHALTHMYTQYKEICEINFIFILFLNQCIQNILDVANSSVDKCHYLKYAPSIPRLTRESVIHKYPETQENLRELKELQVEQIIVQPL